jgi:hypothetical protein
VRPPDPQVAPAPPPLAFEWAQVRILSTPSGADVKDLTLNKVIGHTPFSFKRKPSQNPRQFELHYKGYIDAVIEVIPDHEKLEVNEKLERGAGRKPPKLQVVGPPGKVELPSTGSGSASTDPPGIKPLDGPDTTVKPATPPTPPPAPPGPPADDDCGDPPCLKRDPSRPAGGSGSAG